MKIERAPVVTATHIPRGVEVQAPNLDAITAKETMNRFRSQVVRTEAALRKVGELNGVRRGWLLAGFHNEFDPTAELYTPHYHSIASGHMIAVLDAMRNSRLYRPRPDDRVRHRVRISRKPLHTLPAPLGYPWQLFWPSRARNDGSDDSVGFTQLRRGKQRLPEPYHTQALLWLDRQRIEDMTLMIGLRVGRDGLVKTYTDGELCL